MVKRKYSFTENSTTNNICDYKPAPNHKTAVYKFSKKLFNVQTAKIKTTKSLNMKHKKTHFKKKSIQNIFEYKTAPCLGGERNRKKRIIEQGLKCL